MGLPKIIQIPYHVLANQNALKFKKGAPLKQFFNINLGIGIIKKTNFMFVFSTYFPIFLDKFRFEELVGWGIKFHIEWVPTRHTFDEPHYPKNKKYLKKMRWCHHHIFSGISCFWGSGVHQKYAKWVLIGFKI